MVQVAAGPRGAEAERVAVEHRRGLAAPVILTWSLLARADCEGPLAAPGLVFAGEASFALYLVHMPVILVDSTFRITPVELIGLFIAAALIAAALHLLVEKPGRTWIRRRFDRRRDELAPAALSPPALREPDDR